MSTVRVKLTSGCNEKVASSRGPAEHAKLDESRLLGFLRHCSEWRRRCTLDVTELGEIRLSSPSRKVPWFNLFDRQTKVGRLEHCVNDTFNKRGRKIRLRKKEMGFSVELQNCIGIRVILHSVLFSICFA